jgi:hypothetical protein
VLAQSFGFTTSGPSKAFLRAADDSQLEGSCLSSQGNSEPKTVESFDHVDLSSKSLFNVCVGGGTNVAGKSIVLEKAFGSVVFQTKFLYFPSLQVSWLSSSGSASPLRVCLQFETFSTEESPLKLTRNPKISVDLC